MVLRSLIPAALLAALGLAGAPARAALPAPTPAQQASAAEAAAKAASAAALDKQRLDASMDQVAQRWRERASQQGWRVNAPVPTSVVAGSAGGAGEAVRPGQGNAHSAPGLPGSGAAAGATGAAASAPPLPIRSEKLGTAPPSSDVKQPKLPMAK